MFCTRCGREQRGRPAFCRSCGERLRSPRSRANSSKLAGLKAVGAIALALILIVVLSVLVRAAAGSLATDTECETQAHLRGMGEVRGVVVGVSDYANIDDLRTPDDGARQIYQQIGYIWGDAAHLALLLDKDATRSHIEQSMKQLALEEDADDVVVFYFTGHGDEDYLAPHDSLPDSYANDISATLLNQWLGVLDSKMIVVVTDSCRSGAYAEKVAGDGRVVLSSSAADEDASRELSDYLVRAFCCADIVDSNTDRQLSMEELYGFLASQGVPGQHPCLFDGGVGGSALLTILAHDGGET